MVFLGLGLIFLSLALHEVGFEPFAEAVDRVRWGFLPIVCMNMLWYFADATGLYFVLRGHSDDRVPGICQVLSAQVCGEALNNVTPFMNLGGEPVKGLLLGESMSGRRVIGAIIVDNTLRYTASIVFIGIGLLLSFFFLDLPLEVRLVVVTVLVMSGAVVGLLIVSQTRGILSRGLSLATKLPLRIRDIEGKLKRVRAVDEDMARFYRHEKREFFNAISMHLFSRFLAAVDVYLVLWFMGVDVSVVTAMFVLSIGLLINFAFAFIPLSLGAAEGGHFFLFDVLGLMSGTGVVYALIGRVRGLIWIVIGLTLLSFKSSKGDAGVVFRRGVP